MALSNKEFFEILNIGIQFSTESDSKKLLDAIVDKAMRITHSDCGCLFLYQNDRLHFRIVHVNSLKVFKGGRGEQKIDLPDIPIEEKTACTYAAAHREIVNVADVYNCRRFDFEYARQYDQQTGYRTQSALVIPLEDNKGNLMGILQVLNAMDEDGNVIPFREEYETVLKAMGALAVIALSNIYYLEENIKQRHSFVNAMATAIDERSPYNGKHTRKVTQYALMLARKINEKHKAGLSSYYFDKEQMDKLQLAALLHDLGKIIIPRSIMNRADRLDREMPALQMRHKLIRSQWRVAMLEGKITPEEYSVKIHQMDRIMDFICRINVVNFLTDENYGYVQQIAEMNCSGEDGEPIPYLTDQEREYLSIRQGTLTREHRKIMETHVEMTSKILSHVHFTEKYKDVPKWAGEHHEFLDGTGYPKHLKGDQLAPESRILTIADIYDALTSPDRPYKSPMPREKAFQILHSMAEAGKVEERYVAWLEEAIREENSEKTGSL